MLYEAEKIVNYVDANYRDAYAEDYTGYTSDAVAENEGLQVMLGMVLWGFGGVEEDGSFTDAVGNSYDLVEVFPTTADYAMVIEQANEGDLAAAFPYESADGVDVLPGVKSQWIGFLGPDGRSNGRRRCAEHFRYRQN